MKKIFKSSLLLSLAIGLMITIFPSESQAASASVSSNIPNTNTRITSNAWISNNFFWQNQSFQVSAEVRNRSTGNLTSATWVRTAWTVSISGIGVSIGPISGNTGSNSFSGFLRNTNASNSSHRGSFNISGLPLRGTISNTASTLIQGVTGSATATASRWY